MGFRWVILSRNPWLSALVFLVFTMIELSNEEPHAWNSMHKVNGIDTVWSVPNNIILCFLWHQEKQYAEKWFDWLDQSLKMNQSYHFKPKVVYLFICNKSWQRWNNFKDSPKWKYAVSPKQFISFHMSDRF